MSDTDTEMEPKQAARNVKVLTEPADVPAQGQLACLSTLVLHNMTDFITAGQVTPPTYCTSSFSPFLCFFFFSSTHFFIPPSPLQSLLTVLAWLCNKLASLGPRSALMSSEHWSIGRAGRLRGDSSAEGVCWIKGPCLSG